MMLMRAGIEALRFTTTTPSKVQRTFSSVGDQVVHGSNVNASCAVANHGVRLRTPISSSDVHVSPWNLFAILLVVSVWNELLEEGSSGVCTAPATGAEVAGVRNFGIGHFLLKGREQWHRPCEFADSVSSFVDTGSEVIVIGPKSSCFVTKRHDTSTCEGGKGYQ